MLLPEEYLNKENESGSESELEIDMDAFCKDIAKLYTHCQYGCGYTTLSASDLKQHYHSCLNKLYDCLFTYCENDQLKRCKALISRKDLLEHLDNRHRADIVILPYSLLTFTLNVGIERLTRKQFCQYLKDERGNHFILIVQHVDPHLFLWRVEVLKSDKNISNYTFRISMYNDNGKEQLSLRASCAELTCNKKYKINDTPCIWLHLEQIKHFIKNNTLTFEISVGDGDNGWA